MTKAESKKRIHELYEKHYGKGKKSKAANAKESMEQKVKVEQKAVVEKKGQSRNDLMLQAKEKGIKNFRVLNREELTKVLDPNVTAESVTEVVQGAVARWKSGWGKKGGRAIAQQS